MYHYVADEFKKNLSRTDHELEGEKNVIRVTQIYFCFPKSIFMCLFSEFNLKFALDMLTENR